MAQRFRDQIVLVTGATSGIGLCVARAFAAEGATVAGTGRDQERLAELGRELDLALTLDVTDETSVEIATRAVLDRYGRVDLLVNNAGVGMFKHWTETSIADMQRVMDVNVWGAVRVTNRLLPSMIEAGRGAVVNVASVAGRRGYANHTAYCASKHAMIGWSEGLRCDLMGTGVDVVVVLPPAVRTPFFENAGYYTFDEDHPNLTPMTPEEVAAGLLDATHGRARTRILSARAKVLYGLSIVAPDLIDRVRGKKS
jgi:NADP-dependent 3-hydroxy acid dehydrogenase YdfG